MVTSLGVYNLSKLSVKRRTAIKKIHSIIIGTIGTEFTLNVPDEYDYRYSSSERRDQAVISILKAIKGQVLPIYFRDEIALKAFTTTKV